MTIYQQELLRQLPKLNCTGQMDDESGMLHISLNGIPLCRAAKSAELYWSQEKLITEEQKDALNAVHKAAQSVREYVSLYEAAPPLGVTDLPAYRRLAEYGDIVLGAMYSEQHGFMFSTWQQDKENAYVARGDYSPDYEYAKESFITRSMLVDKNRLFTLEEAESLYRCIDYVRENCETLTYDQERQLKGLSEKMAYGYPQLEENSPSFEQDDTPQLNM